VYKGSHGFLSGKSRWKVKLGSANLGLDGLCWRSGWARGFDSHHLNWAVCLFSFSEFLFSSFLLSPFVFHPVTFVDLYVYIFVYLYICIVHICIFHICIFAYLNICIFAKMQRPCRVAELIDTDDKKDKIEWKPINLTF
jgi:hypothetical protein